jgi:flagellar hook-associated protein 3 FlgL
MGAVRITTNGLYRNYRTNLTKNINRLNDTMTDVQTERKFNAYAEDPVAASKAWRLRRDYWRTGDQIDNNNQVISKYESAYSAMAAVVDGDTEHPGLDGILASIEGVSDSAGSSRSALGRDLISTAESIVSMMNSRYGDDFIFAGADGENIPFEWDGDKLLYRGVDVSTPKTDYVTADFLDSDGNLDQAKYDEQKELYEDAHPGYLFKNALKLNEMANETTYVDIGLGMKEDADGNLITGSAFNSAVSGLQFLNYGEDNNLAVLMRELGQIFENTDPETGSYASDADKERADELLNKIHDAVRYSQGQHVKLSADAKFLKTNLQQLETNKGQLNEQIMDTEGMDPAEAITEMSWAQYCYNAALRIGTNILSQSLIDYMS